jgi:hypothetical protein
MQWLLFLTHCQESLRGGEYGNLKEKPMRRKMKNMILRVMGEKMKSFEVPTKQMRRVGPFGPFNQLQPTPLGVKITRGVFSLAIPPRGRGDMLKRSHKKEFLLSRLLSDTRTIRT